MVISLARDLLSGSSPRVMIALMMRRLSSGPMTETSGTISPWTNYLELGMLAMADLWKLQISCLKQEHFCHHELVLKLCSKTLYEKEENV